MDISFVLRKFRKSIAGFTILALISSFFATSVAFAGSLYDDVDNDAWYATYVETAADEGWMTGYADGTFGPDDTLTRGQLAKVAVLAFLGEDAVVDSNNDAFTDISGHWAEDYIGTAELFGIMNGYTDADGDLTGLFGPDDTVNRAQAVKTLVDAAGLTVGTDSGSDIFSDVTSGSWYDEYVGTAYSWSVLDGYENGLFGPADNVTRAQIAKMTVNAETPVARGDDDDDDDDSTGATLTVELSADSPEADTIPDKATSVELATWDFTADGGDVVLDDLTLHQYGVSSLPSTHQVYLYEGADRLTSGTTVNSSSHEVRFTNLNLTVEDGDTRSLTIRMDMGDATSTGEVGFEVETASAVVTDGAEVDGVFPVQGEKFSTATSEVGTVTITKNGTVTNANVGEDDVIIGKFKIAASGEAANLEELGIYLTGSINSSDVENFGLYVSGSSDAIATVDAVDSNDVVRFVLDTPYEIPKGSSKAFTLRADFNTGRTGDTVKIYVDEDTDVVAIGDLYGYGMQVNRQSTDSPAGSYDGTSCTSSAGDCSYSSLEGGDITISSSGPAASDVATNAEDVALMNFSIVAAADITFKSFPIALWISDDTADATEGFLSDASGTPANVTDIKVVNTDTGDELMTSFDADTLTTTLGGSTAVSETTTSDTGTKYHVYSDDFTMAAGEELNLALTVDIANETALSGETLYATLPLGDSTSYPEIRDVNNKTLTNSTSLVPASTITGKTMTVTTPSLALSVASTPVIGSTTWVKGSDDVQFVGFIFACGDGADCTVTDVTVTGYIDDSGATTFVAGADSGNNDVSVSSIVGSVWLEDGDGNALTVAKSVNSTTGDATFTSMDWTIAAGNSEIVYVVGDINSDAYKNSNAESVAFEIDSTDNVTVEDEEGNTFTPTGTPNTDEGVYVLTSDGGSLTIAVDADTANEDIAVSGSTGVELSKFKFTSTDEAFLVTNLSINNRQSAVTSTATRGDYDNNVNKIVLTYPDSNGNEATATGYLNNGTASFSGLDFYIAADSDEVLTVSADINTISSGNATAAEFVELNLAFNNFEAVADASGETYKADKLDQDVTATSDLDFGSISWTDSSYDTNNDGEAVTGGSTQTITIDTGTAVFPVGTLLFVDADAGADYDEASESLFIVSDTWSTTTPTVFVANDDEAALAQNLNVYYSLPSSGYLTDSNRVHVYESKPTVTLSASSPSGSRTVSASDNAFIFTVSAASQDLVEIRGATELTTTAAGVGALCTPAADTTAGDHVDSSGVLCTTAGNTADDTFVYDAGATGLIDDYARVNFWIKWTDVGGTPPQWADLAIGTGDTNATTAPGQTTAFSQTACGADGTTMITTEWYNCDLALPTGTDASDQYLHFVLVDATRLLATDTVHTDVVRLYNEKLVIDVDTDGDLDTYANNTSNADAPSVAYLKQGSSTVATGYWSTATNGASATNSGSVTFIPTSDIEIAKGTSKTFTLQIDSADLLNEDSGSDDPVTLSFDLGTAANGTVTAGDFWWYESNATVKWLGDVSNTTFSGNTLQY